MEAQAFICPWCIDDHGSLEKNTHCKNAFERGRAEGIREVEARINGTPPTMAGVKFCECCGGVIGRNYYAFNAGKAEGITEERARVVAFLRNSLPATQDWSSTVECDAALSRAESIERGDHDK